MRAGTGRLGLLPSRVAALPQGLKRAPDQGPAPQRNEAPWKRWYDTARWKKARMDTFVRDGFTCRMCGKLEGDTSKLTCDHIKPHRGNATLFWDPENRQTLCTSPCHVKHKQALEQGSRHQKGVWD